MINSVSNKRLSTFSRTSLADSDITDNPCYQNKGFFPAIPEEDEDPLDEILDEEEIAGLLSVEDINYIRDFIVGSALYVEELENQISERSDDFWESREHAYRIITGLLIDLYQFEMAE
ncbi:MAG TPA: hypothetical protein VG537_03855 [Candidatus Kapabacteria bacterium]|jgi:hypothetical protein|nr:hypothetical protein [Candidatus Kapabacteria bacterium]